MFAVVENEQQAPIGQEGDERVEDGTAGLFPDAERAGNRVGNEARIAERRKFDDPHAVRVVAQQVGADLYRQSSLAEAAGTGECHEPRRPQQRGEVGSLAFASDEGCELLGQV